MLHPSGGTRRLAVIGGGAAAVSLLDSLLRGADLDGPPLAVTIYEPDSLARGRAYRPDLDSALINRQAGYMSIRAGERRHFLDCLAAGGRHYDVESYVPRHLFGDYLDLQLRRCLDEAEARGWRVRVRAEAVLDAARDTDQWTVYAEGSTESADAIVLCLGTGVPGDPFRLAGTPGFVADPYPLRESMPRIPQRARVLVLGTGLSGVDCVLALRHVGNQGGVTLASRRGFLPGVRASPVVITPKHLVPEAITTLAARQGHLTPADLLRLVEAELAGHGADLVSLWQPADHGHDAADFLRQQLALVDGNPLQSLAMHGLLHLRSVVWSALSEADRQYLAEHLNTRLKSLYNPMPPPTARTLLAEIESGRLQVVRGVRSVRPVPGGGFDMVADERAVPADVVIDTTRVGLAGLNRPGERFLTALVGRGHAAWHPQGGLRVDLATGALEGEESAYAIGEITAGQAFFASSMFMINRGADVVSSAVLRRLTADRPHGAVPA
jgi:uncharacterized NAD(P)/FAD-binding protein YdhS